MNPDPRIQTEEEWRISMSERMARLETKMNILAAIGGAGLVAFFGLFSWVLMHV